jgi:hypothetical protein
MSKILELYGISTRSTDNPKWQQIVDGQFCPYLKRKCIKVRKSEPDVTIGTCTVLYGKKPSSIIICPHRLLECHQVFADCLHLLTLHEPGNELHVVPEITIPGGSVDYFLVSVRQGKVKDFIGVELQTLDTTGTVWPERQRFIRDEKAIYISGGAADSKKGYGMNWKMTAKTILIQLHHKVQTFESLNKHLALVIQDHFLSYIQKEFRFEHLNSSRVGDSMHIHAYRLSDTLHGALKLELTSRHSTDAAGIADALGLQASPKVELDAIVQLLQAKISAETRFNLIVS